MLVVNVKGRPWVDRQAGISNISIELTLGITSLCLHRGLFFAPHNLYRGEDRYRWLNRKANTVKATLFSLIIAQHQRPTHV
jgi:hypothetical protein